MKNRLNVNKALITAIGINTVQLGAITGIFVLGRNANHHFELTGEYIFLAVVLIGVFINSFITIRDAYTISRSGMRFDMIKNSLAQVQDLNNALRAQRHDFLNNLQVVYGLIEMDEYTEAKDYIEKVYNDIQKVSRVLKTSNPAINALLQAKTLYCESRGIALHLNVLTHLENLKIPSWELCRILGNLIDNATDALEDVTHERLLELEISENVKYYVFKVRDNGPMIPHDHLNKIFEARFTTKAGKGEGMGLSITKDLVCKNGGTISVDSTSNTTVFEVSIPK